jgi:hypothetical protein
LSGTLNVDNAIVSSAHLLVSGTPGVAGQGADQIPSPISLPFGDLFSPPQQQVGSDAWQITLLNGAGPSSFLNLIFAAPGGLSNFSGGDILFGDFLLNIQICLPPDFSMRNRAH